MNPQNIKVTDDFIGKELAAATVFVERYRRPKKRLFSDQTPPCRIACLRTLFQ